MPSPEIENPSNLIERDLQQMDADTRAAANFFAEIGAFDPQSRFSFGALLTRFDESDFLLLRSLQPEIWPGFYNKIMSERSRMETSSSLSKEGNKQLQDINANLIKKLEKINQIPGEELIDHIDETDPFFAKKIEAYATSKVGRESKKSGFLTKILNKF